MKKFTILFLLVLPVLCRAEKTSMFADSLRHEVRVGWGDPIFESAMKYEFPHLGKPFTEVTYLPGHWFAEYQYYWLSWLSTGMIVDYTGMGWRDKNDSRHTNHCYYDISILPTVRFTYYRHPWVKLYSAVMVGVTVNGGTELDPVRNTKTVCYPGVGITALGMQVGQKGFYGAVEIGGLSALMSFQDIALLSSRMITLSIGYKFNAPRVKKEGKL
ncbi:MAG: hypothetical protein MJZ75_00735 [Paludibacteraceae bacterium]|nr:hypothetical protein [Paludibacteraceae bacterium]